MKLAIVLVLTAAGLLAVLWGMDVQDAAQSLAAFDWRSFVLAWSCYWMTQAIRCWRTRILLGRPVPFWRLMSITGIGYLAITVIPFRMGELVRPTLLTDEGVPFGEGVAAIFMERLADILVLLGFLLSVGFMVELPPAGIMVPTPWLPTPETDVMAAGQRLFGISVGGGVTLLLALTLAGDRALVYTDKLPAGLMVRRFVEGARRLMVNPLNMARVLGLSLLVWVFTLIAVWASMASFPGLPSDLGAVVFTWTLTLTGLAAIPTPGFFGGFEAMCVAALTVLHADGDKARTFALLLHLGQFAFTISIGTYYVLKEGLSLRDLVKRSASRQV